MGTCLKSSMMAMS